MYNNMYTMYIYTILYIYFTLYINGFVLQVQQTRYFRTFIMTRTCSSSLNFLYFTNIPNEIGPFLKANSM